MERRCPGANVPSYPRPPRSTRVLRVFSNQPGPSLPCAFSSRQRIVEEYALVKERQTAGSAYRTSDTANGALTIRR
jgi:hypothetical protein